MAPKGASALSGLSALKVTYSDIEVGIDFDPGELGRQRRSGGRPDHSAFTGWAGCTKCRRLSGAVYHDELQCIDESQLEH